MATNPPLDPAAVCDRFEAAWERANDLAESTRYADPQLFPAWCSDIRPVVGAVESVCAELAELVSYWRRQGMPDMAQKYRDRERECTNVLRRIDRCINVGALHFYRPADFDA